MMKKAARKVGTLRHFNEICGPTYQKLAATPWQGKK
jgi:hypothetical protein